jgi:hypothetical protein
MGSHPQDPQAIYSVQNHMNQQSQSGNSETWTQQKSKIYCDSRPAVKRMKSKSATVWIKDWVRQQVIKIYCHCQRHDHKGAYPVFSPASFSNHEGYQKMEYHVNDAAFHL